MTLLSVFKIPFSKALLCWNRLDRFVSISLFFSGFCTLIKRFRQSMSQKIFHRVFVISYIKRGIPILGHLKMNFYEDCKSNLKTHFFSQNDFNGKIFYNALRFKLQET